MSGTGRSGELERFAIDRALTAAWTTEFWIPADPDYGFVDYFEAAALRNLDLLHGLEKLAEDVDRRGILPSVDSDQARLVTDGGQPAGDTEQRDGAIVRVEIKETRHRNIAGRSEVDGPSGLRGPTDAERKASELHNKILDRIDESEYSSGDVIADIHVPRSGDPWIDWNDEVVGAAGNDPHVAADGGPEREEHKSKILERLRESKERNGFWPAKGPFLESLDYVIEDAYDALDAWDELLEEDEIEKFEGREGTQVRIVETDDGQRTLHTDTDPNGGDRA